MSYGAAPPIWYSFANVVPVLRLMATQLKVGFAVEVGRGPVRAWTSVFHRLAETLPVQLQVIVPLPLSVQLQGLSASCVLASIIRSIDPELSMRSRTLGSGGVVSTCCARATEGAATSARPVDAAINDLVSLL